MWPRKRETLRLLNGLRYRRDRTYPIRLSHEHLYQPRDAWRPRSHVGLGLPVAACLRSKPVWPHGPRAARGEEQVLRLTINGMQFRIPGSYMQPSSDPRSPSKYLHFSFWVSDGKPIQVGVPEIGSKDRVGRAIFWAPEPGRPYNSSDDFVVLVIQALPGTEESLSRRQDSIRQRIAGLHGTASTEDGLECRLYKSGAKDCATAPGHNPKVTMDILSVMPNNPTWRMIFYSPADSLWVELRFPVLGQSRWPEVVCRTLLLIRSWRTSGAPPSPDCSKQSTLS